MRVGSWRKRISRACSAVVTLSVVAALAAMMVRRSATQKSVSTSRSILAASVIVTCM
jgi:hypothetical protein